MLGALAQVVTSAIATYRQNKTTSDLGRVTAERDAAIAANKAKDAELQAQADAPKDIDGALKRLDGGTA